MVMLLSILEKGRRASVGTKKPYVSSHKDCCQKPAYKSILAGDSSPVKGEEMSTVYARPVLGS